MGAAFLITLREGMEVALILAIILAYLRSVGRPDRFTLVWAGAGAAAALSLLAGAIIFAVSGGLSHTAAEVFEGVASYLAVGVLTWMIFWMRRNAARIKGELQEKVDLALASGSNLALVAVSFLVVVREGLETVLFLFSASRAGSATPAMLRLTGALLGLVAAGVLGLLFYRGGIRLNLRTFFRLTGILILVVAASLLVYGTHELLEVGAFRFLDGTGLLAPAGVIASIMGAVNRIVVGLRSQPTWLEFGGWLAYLAVTGVLFFRPVRPPAPGRAPDAGHPVDRSRT
ncbi:MAG TPA: FTR1 family protein [Actinomycetota bacterium]|jgi:high-affinity iron transporter|nr:FTR1 family protein [Actinomycetota bacterium]